MGKSTYAMGVGVGVRSKRTCTQMKVGVGGGRSHSRLLRSKEVVSISLSVTSRCIGDGGSKWTFFHYVHFE